MGTEIAIWVIAILLALLMLVIVYAVRHALQIARHQHQATMASLNSLNDTHKLGLDSMTRSMQQLEQRVKTLEEKR
jgi:hypothetical protein